jgi:hypothetical protein
MLGSDKGLAALRGGAKAKLAILLAGRTPNGAVRLEAPVSGAL